MNHETFKAVLSKSSRRIAIVGVFIAAFGGFMMAAIFLDENKPVYWVLVGFFLLLGLAMAIMGFRGLARIKSGEYPLLKAINTNEKDYLVWVYKKEITTSVEGVKAGKTYNLVIVNKHGKSQEIVLGKGKKVSPDQLVEYLSAQFPDAYTGYADDTRKAVSERFGKKF